MSLTRGDTSVAFATCEDSAGNVSDSSNSVTTEVCDPEDIFDSSLFSSGFGDSESDPTDYWATLTDDGTVVITIEGNLVDSTDEDWFILYTEDTTTSSGTDTYNFQVTMTDGTGTYTFIVYREQVSTSEDDQMCVSSDPDGYDTFDYYDTRSSCGSDPSEYCDDFSYTWYIEVLRDSSVSPSCQGYTLEITNG